MIIKIINIVSGIILVIGTMVLLSFNISHNAKIPVQKLEIQVSHQCGNHFVEAQEIRSLVKQYIKTEEGSQLTKGKLKDIEKLISGMPHVERAHVYRTINGAIHINTSQRMPLLRVLNSSNEGYYIDINGRMMPLSSKYTARVIVATGNINSQYSPYLNLLESTPGKEIPGSEKTLRELFKLASYINQHTFWNAFIDQIYVTQGGEFELVPKNGSHIIEFGKTDMMEEKFIKLMTFYQNGLTRVGWHHYNRVNVKFTNQIICSK